MALSVSVIVPVLNEQRALDKLLSQFIQLDKPVQQQFEVVICDGGSTDISAATVRKYQHQPTMFAIHWLLVPLGRARQMAAGVKKAQGEILFFVHADSILPHNWFDLIQQHSWGRFDVSLSGQQRVFRVIEWMMNKRSCLTQVATGDQGIFIKRSLYLAVNGWDPMPLMEDIAMSKKLRKQTSMACIPAVIKTSSRRWEKNGIVKTVLLMWWLRALYFCGVSTGRLHQMYYPEHKTKLASVLQVFSKLPIKGKVKTRLIPDIGINKATLLHQFLLDNCLKRCEKYKCAMQLWFAPYESIHLPFTMAYQNYHMIIQPGEDLGQKMGYAIQQGLQRYNKVVLIGTDQMDINNQLIDQCMKKLDHFEVVIIPALDGGFVTIACTVYDDAFFEHIEWSTALVLNQLQFNLDRLMIQYTLLKPVRDIDTIDDVHHYAELVTLINEP